MLSQINKVMAKQKHPFTKSEKKVMKLILSAHEEFSKLERKHPMEMQEWVFAIHQLQSILSHRSMVRLFPKYFK